jgi:hypothetical protein
MGCARARFKTSIGGGTGSLFALIAGSAIASRGTPVFRAPSCELGVGIVRWRGGDDGKGAEGKIKAPTPFGCQVIVCTSFSVVPLACRGLGNSVGRAPGGRFACLRAALLVGWCFVGHDGGESGLHRILKHGR